jgi:hypothetical protein
MGGSIGIKVYYFFAVFVKSGCNNVKGVESGFFYLIVPSGHIKLGTVFDGTFVKYHLQAV